jgi:hypothetical protein
MTNTVWNTGDSTAHIATSDTDHTATSGSGSGNEGIRATVSHATGKWFIEFTNVSYLYGGWLGFAAASDTLGGTGQFGIDSGGNSHFTSGSSSGDPGSNPTGHVVDFAIDLDNSLMWSRYDGGNWNGSGTADPATGAGGHSISGFTGPVFPYAWLQFNPDTVTIDGGDYPSPTFIHPAPSGFTPWNGISGVSGTWASTEAADIFAAIGYPGYPGIDGQLVATEATDVFSATGLIVPTGVWASTEHPDQFSAYGYMVTTGTMAVTEHPDTFAATGFGQGIDGAWASTEIPDHFAAVGFQPISGTFIVTEAPDRFSALGEGVTQVRRRRPFFVT